MLRAPVRLFCAIVALSLAATPGVRAAEDAGPRVLSKAEFHAVAVEGLKSANGFSRARAADRFAQIMDAARTYPGESSLARKVRTGYGHYQRSKNIRKKHVEQILSLFATAQVAELSRKEADGVLEAWPGG